MEQSFQDQGAVLHCYGCGADNARGFRIKSFWDGDEAVCRWRAEAHLCGGRREIVNGGVIATLIDCHSLNLAVARAYKNEGRAIGSVPVIGYVTGNLSVSYLKPAPIDGELELRARITKLEGRKAWVECTLSAGGEVCAKGEVLGIRVERD
ncbi:MAG TPA: PaaI family thioesterase [Candidatus Binatia bacterium]